MTYPTSLHHPPVFEGTLATWHPLTCSAHLIVHVGAVAAVKCIVKECDVLHRRYQPEVADGWPSNSDGVFKPYRGCLVSFEDELCHRDVATKPQGATTTCEETTAPAAEHTEILVWIVWRYGTPQI